LVATDLPSVREVTGAAALLFPVGDADALAGAVAFLLDDRERREALARAGRERAREFTWPQMAEKVVEAYHRAVAL
jgi:phosphatidylinositol alpha-mannosyltransferase